MTPGAVPQRHCLADLFGIPGEALTRCDALEEVLRQAAAAAGAQVLYARFHSFGSGQGVTGVVLLAESHISIHTWPEHHYAAADIFLCGSADPRAALAVLVERLKPTAQHVRHLERGQNAPPAAGIPSPATEPAS